MTTLELFNAVVAKESTQQTYISSDGFLIVPEAIWAAKQILAHYKKEKLNGNDLNKTFHKSWNKILTTPQSALVVEQIRHYISTYGSNFQAEMYIPLETLNIPELKLTYKVIRAFSKEEMTDRCLAMLQSGIALKEETVDSLITVLADELDYEFTGKEGIRNKEAICKIGDLYNVYPENATEFLRYVVYKTTGETLLIKNKNLIQLIKDGSFNPVIAFRQFGLERLAEIFNRFKPLFLAYKKRASKTINKISKLSKTLHKPLVSNALNEVTQRFLTDTDIHWLDNATPFALFKALNACNARANGQDAFVYRIRSGKSWVTENPTKKKSINKHNYKFITNYMKQRFDLSGKSVFLPKNVNFALPTSEKMFSGNFPCGTVFTGKKLAVGIYWENSWGTKDLDLSGINIGGKVGWNADYEQGGSLIFSGDMTNAPTGACEYLYARDGLVEPTLVKNNIYPSGDKESDFKIIIGKGSSVTKDFMMNPNKLMAEIKTKTAQKESYIGLLMPKGELQQFILLNFGASELRVSGNSDMAAVATKALVQQWSNTVSFNKMVKLLGAEIVDTPIGVDYDFSLSEITKDSFINIFK